MSNQHSESDLHSTNTPQHNESWLFSRNGVITIGMLAILGFLVYTGHSAHLLGWAPFLLILACPLMHIFMHGGHGKHEKDDTKAEAHAHGHSHGSGCCGGGDHKDHGDHNEKSDKKPSSNSTQGE